MKVFLCTVFSLLLLIKPVLADEKSAAEEFIKRNLDAVFAVLQKKDLSPQDRKSQVLEIVTPMFDFERMAKLSLGRKHWSNMPPEHRERFTELFVQRLRQSYLDKLTAYTDEKIVYESPIADEKKVHVPTILISSGKKISMLYKLYPADNTWKIYDVEIEGVSIIRSYRAQFNEILQKGTFEDLLEKMQKPANT